MCRMSIKCSCRYILHYLVERAIDIFWDCKQWLSLITNECEKDTTPRNISTTIFWHIIFIDINSLAKLLLTDLNTLDRHVQQLDRV
jgi:hypothetical protein